MSSYVYNKSANGTTYVYLNESYWDREAGKTRHKRRCVGKLDPVTGKVVPTAGRSRPKAAVGPAFPGEAASCRARVIGPYLLLEKAARETGIAEDLEAVFKGGFALKLLSCACFLASEGGPLSLIGPWSKSNAHPWQGELSLGAVRDLLGRLAPGLARRFMARRFARARGALTALDVALRAPAGGLTASAGAAQEGLGRFLALVDEASMPVSYGLSDGPLEGLAASGETPACSCPGAAGAVRLVAGEGFLKGNNLEEALSRASFFCCELPPGSAIAAQAAACASSAGLSLGHIDADGGRLSCATGPLRAGGRGFYLHAYFGAGREPRAREALSGSVEASCGGLAQGSLVLLSDCIPGAQEAFGLYRKRELLKKSLGALWDRRDAEGLRLCSKEAVSRRLFLHFIALSLNAYLESFIREEAMSKAFRLREYFGELKSVQRVSFPESRAELTTVFTDRQREILALYGVEA